uniref:Ovule protein n=1 Tax=Ascaris lumbricoides TaxID=6252 RepID=A0A0M3HYG8_ASCLU
MSRSSTVMKYSSIGPHQQNSSQQFQAHIYFHLNSSKSSPHKRNKKKTSNFYNFCKKELHVDEKEQPN